MYVMFVTIFFYLVYASLIIYYRLGWLQIQTMGDLKQESNRKLHTTISVIISARNEEENIRECLESIVMQNYPRELFETIVVDDFSTDNTAKIISSFYKKDVSLISLKDFIGEQRINSYKKKAIEIAIAQSTGELIVTTDADCFAKENWLEI